MNELTHLIILGSLYTLLGLFFIFLGCLLFKGYQIYSERHQCDCVDKQMEQLKMKWLRNGGIL